MATKSNVWTRRAFSQAVALSAGSMVLGRRALASAIGTSSSAFTYVGSSPSAGDGSITVFEHTQNSWRPIQTVSALAPVHLEVHPSLPVLYAVHEVDSWHHRPRGAVSVYSIDPRTGELELRMTQPLSLSAINPRHAALSQDGRDLVVAARGGGVYNVLAIAGDGSLQPPVVIRKELGRTREGITTGALPNHLLSHPGGRFLLAADPGAQTVTAFRLGQETLDVVSRTPLQEDSSPSQIALAASGRWVFAMHTSGSISAHTFDPDSGKLGPASPTACSPSLRHSLLAPHPDRQFLVTGATTTHAAPITLWRIHDRDGSLQRVRLLEGHRALSGITFSPDGLSLLLTEADSGRIIGRGFQAASAAFGRARTLAQLERAQCMAFHSA